MTGMLGTAGLLLALGVTAARAEDKAGQPAATAAKVNTIGIPRMDAARGRQLFVNKSCVLCHSVQKVGGKGALALDAPADQTQIDLMGFVARMWRGAPAMTALQSQELGYVIQLQGGEIADLAAFLSDPAAQQGFSIREVPESMRDSFIDKPYWETDTWPDDIGLNEHGR